MIYLYIVKSIATMIMIKLYLTKLTVVSDDGLTTTLLYGVIYIYIYRKYLYKGFSDYLMK